MSKTPVRRKRPAWLRLPNSLLTRILAVLLLAIFIAQGLSSALWFTQLQSRQNTMVLATAEQLALSMATTARFFNSLPLNYRHIVLDQLRRMGGSRFFISFNTRQLPVPVSEDSDLKTSILDRVHDLLTRELGYQVSIDTQLSIARDLRVFNQAIPLMELPPGWGHHALVLDPDRTPILVVQIQTEDSGWLYMATVVPTPTGTLDTETLSAERLLFLGLTVILISLAAFLLVRSFLRPLAMISRAADELGKGNDHPPIAESGSYEVARAARSFNAMRHRIERYINDRNRFFSAISHDLRTPITRLRLRAELLDDETLREKFCQDLEDLSDLAQGALQSINDTTLREESTKIDICQLLRRLAETAELEGEPVAVNGSCRRMFIGKPLALKRALGNLLDNALFYGKKAEINVQDDERQLRITIRDYGPGIPEAARQRVFEPYVRLESSRNRNTGGAGLGLSIARSIIRGHGGNVLLSNHPEGGLLVTVLLPRA